MSRTSSIERMASDWIPAEAQAQAARNLSIAVDNLNPALLKPYKVTKDQLKAALQAGEVKRLTKKLNDGWVPKMGWITPAATMAASSSGGATEDDIDRIAYQMLLREIPEEELIREAHVTRAQVRATVPAHILQSLSL